MTDLTIQDETFHIEIEGDPTKPSVILSNSLGTDLHVWDEQMPALLEHFRVVRYDPRGHGRSGVGTRPYSIARLGLDVLAILDALEIESAHFIGISMGGAVGQWLLAHAPARLGRVVLANTAARFGTGEGWNARILSVRRDGMADNAGETIARWFSDAFRNASSERVATIHATLANASVEGYARACAALRDLDLRSAASDPSSEVLVITGADDPVISAQDTAVLLSGLPGARHVELDAMHLSNIEAAASFNEAVLRFLTGPKRAAARKSVPVASRRASPRTEKSGRKLVARSPARALPATGRTAGAAARISTREKASPPAEPTKATTRTAETSRRKATQGPRGTAVGKSAKAVTVGRGTSAARGIKATAAAKTRGATSTKARARSAAATTKPAASRSAKTTAARKTPASKKPESKTEARRARPVATSAQKVKASSARSPARQSSTRVGTGKAPGTTVTKPSRTGAAKIIGGTAAAKRTATKVAPAKKSAAKMAPAPKAASKPKANKSTIVRAKSGNATPARNGTATTAKAPVVKRATKGGVAKGVVAKGATAKSVAAKAAKSGSSKGAATKSTPAKSNPAKRSPAKSTPTKSETTASGRSASPRKR